VFSIIDCREIKYLYLLHNYYVFIFLVYFVLYTVPNHQYSGTLILSSNFFLYFIFCRATRDNNTYNIVIRKIAPTTFRRIVSGSHLPYILSYRRKMSYVMFILHIICPVAKAWPTVCINSDVICNVNVCIFMHTV